MRRVPIKICIKFTEPDRADISSAESVMENISTVVLIVLVAAVVVAAVACSGHRRWH
jgi:hypothetical protein